mmetsp:Transcript_78835/g.239106  ORF Transcript_78835/g.239106 Transcript_78835/m.239106 type:complete len:286 (-) Transcript_78835:118-975(-)
MRQRCSAMKPASATKKMAHMKATAEPKNLPTLASSLGWCRAEPCSAWSKAAERAEGPQQGAPDCLQAHEEQPEGSGGLKDAVASDGKEEHEQEVVMKHEEMGEAVGPADAVPAGGISHEEDLLLDVAHPNYREVACADGGVYRGQVLPGREAYHGYGCLRSAETTAVGYWCNGKLHGQGQQSWPDGRVYRGQFRGGAFAGRGRMQWRHGRGAMVYEGEYLDDKKHGEGRFTWPSGKAYDGQWVRGQRHGVGEDISADGVRCRGLWQDNVFLHSIGAGCDAGESAK